MSKKIAVIGAGGTIAMEGVHPFDWVDYGDSGVVNNADQVVARMDAIFDEARRKNITIETVSFRQIPSTGISYSDWNDLLFSLKRLVERNCYDGFVITHGTATLEETAFFIKSTLPSNVPVVFCGSQRPPNTSSSDAESSLRNSILAASDLPAGVYVVMNSYVYDPDDITKTSNFALDAFEAPEFGPVGRIEPSGKLHVSRMARPSPISIDLSVVDILSLPRVDLVHSYVGADGVAINALVNAGAEAVISVGFPPGRCTPGEREELLKAREKGVTIIQSSRASRGQVPTQKYNDDDLIISGGGLAPNKAKIIVQLMLASGVSDKDVEKILAYW